MPVTIINNLPQRYSAEALKLYLTALGEKLIPIFGDARSARKILSARLSNQHCLAAICDGQLVGLLGIQTSRRGFLNPTLKAMIDGYGMLGGCFRMGGLLLLHHTSGRKEWYLDGIAVKQTYRGCGIGTRLLERFEYNARCQGIQKLSLEVIDTNPRAKALYTRLGFRASGRESVWPFNYLYKFRFKSAWQMEKLVSAPAPKVELEAAKRSTGRTVI